MRDPREIEDLQPWYYPLQFGEISVQPGLPNPRNDSYGFTTDELVGHAEFRRHLLVDNALKHFDTRGARVLELGCNCGYFGAEYAKRGAGSYLGVEGREFHARQGRLYWDWNQFLPSDSWGIICGDVLETSVQQQIADAGPFDVCLCLGLIYHVPDPEDFLRKICGWTQRAIVMEGQLAPNRPSPLSGRFRETPGVLSAGRLAGRRSRHPTRRQVFAVLEEWGGVPINLEVPPLSEAGTWVKSAEEYVEGSRRIAVVSVRR